MRAVDARLNLDCVARDNTQLLTLGTIDRNEIEEDCDAMPANGNAVTIRRAEVRAVSEAARRAKVW